MSVFAFCLFNYAMLTADCIYNIVLWHVGLRFRILENKPGRPTTYLCILFCVILFSYITSLFYPTAVGCHFQPARNRINVVTRLIGKARRSSGGKCQTVVV
jgi:hypothetical protein